MELETQSLLLIGKLFAKIVWDQQYVHSIIEYRLLLHRSTAGTVHKKYLFDSI